MLCLSVSIRVAAKVVGMISWWELYARGAGLICLGKVGLLCFACGSGMPLMLWLEVVAFLLHSLPTRIVII